MTQHEEGASGAGSSTEDEIMSASLEQGAPSPESVTKMVLLPLDDPNRSLNDSGLPSVMIWAGGEAYDALRIDQALDLDSCSLAVGIYRAMTEAHAKEIATLSAPASGAERMTAGEVDWRKVMRDLLREHDKHICLHEETHRGGVIWTICDHCGRKWADDEGGFQPYEEPAAVTAAWAALKCEEIATPAPATPPGVPDSVRALSEAATPGEWYAASGTDIRALPAISAPIGMTSPSGNGNGLNDRAFIVAAVNYVRALIATHPAGQSAGSGADPYPNNRIGAQMRTAASILNAPDSTRTGDEGPCLRAVIEVRSDRTDTRLTFGKGLKHEGGCNAVEQAIIALRSELDQRDACPASAGPSNDYGETGAKALNAAILAQCASPRICSGKGRVTEGIRCGPCERKALEAALAARPAAPEAQGAERGGFNAGYAMACANIVNLHGEDTIAEDVLAESGITLAEIKALDLTDYDMKPLRALFREIARKRKARKSRPAPPSSSGQRGR